MRVRVVLSAIAALAVAFFCSFAARAQKNQLRIAAAADLKFALAELAAQYEKQAGTKVEVTYGSSGNFFSQIQNGAPFDLFFSADIDYPGKLVDSGWAKPSTLREYAIGRIVIWTPPDARLDPEKSSWNALLDSRVQKIAIANPAHAPYGRAAVAALLKAGIYEKVYTKLVYGENISQAAQFVESGNAQAGILALSLVLSPAMSSGKRWEIPSEMYPPIRQAAVVLNSAENEAGARGFLDFVTSATGQQILATHGFASPASSKSQARAN